VGTSSQQTFVQQVTRWLTVIRGALAMHTRSFKHRIVKMHQHFQQQIRLFRRRYARKDPAATTFRMFEAEGNLESVVFMKPDQTLFQSVDLQRVRFRGTNLRGLRFLDVSWWQQDLGRNGLYEDVWARSMADGPYRYEFLPVLEETCRNARVAMEENRSFNVASDFYIGEMDALRNQMEPLKRFVFSVPAAYRLVSIYGTSVGRAIEVLLFLCILHITASIVVADGIASLRLDQLNNAALHSLGVFTLHSPDAEEAKTVAQTWIDVVFRVIVPIQIAMLALAFRSRIKRH
jgi:hypothetical protein